LRELLTHTLLLQRPLTVTVEFQDASGAKQRLALDELQARIFLHEFDHLQSVLFHDRMEPEVLATVQPQLDALEAAYAANRPAA
jgi:peptide deformylase